VSFSCNDGFSPPYSTTICQATKVWSPQPVCTEVTCKVPGLINGRYTTDPSIREANEHEPYKTEISPICNEGYMLSSDLSFAQRTCESDGQWSGTVVNCDPITCDHFPEQFDHGYYYSRDTKPPFSYNHAIAVACYIGYNLAEPATRRCIEPNTWSGKDPECGRITCRSPNTFRYGKYNGSRSFYDFGTVLVPTCNTGYYMSNNVEKRVCEQHNSWSETDPECQRITCRSPTPFMNGKYNESQRSYYSSQPSYDFGSVLIPTCHTGYYMSTNVKMRVCEQNIWYHYYGSWSGPDPECRQITCRSPKTFSNGQYNPSQTSYDFKSVLVPTCYTGYYMSNNVEKRVCEQNGMYGFWSGLTDPECRRITCRSPTTFSNGQYNGSHQVYDFGTVLVPTCNTGYYMSNNLQKRVCEQNIWYHYYGSWSGTDPECRRITCRPPKTFNNGQYNESQPSYDFGTVLVPTCNTGYDISHNIEKRVCEEHNKWSGSTPVCEIVECQTPTVLNGNFTSSTSRRKSFRYRDEISIHCDQGYEFNSGSATRTCQANGRWDLPPMECVKFLCNDTSDIKHAAIPLTAYPTLAFGQSGNVTFNSTFFYLQLGSVEVTCLETRKLSWVTKPDFGMILYC